MKHCTGKSGRVCFHLRDLAFGLEGIWLENAFSGQKELVCS